MFEKLRDKKANERKEQRMTEDLDVVVKFVPQCSGCKYNIGIDECSIYGMKPTKYVNFEEECPARKEFTWD